MIYKMSLFLNLLFSDKYNYILYCIYILTSNIIIGFIIDAKIL